MEQHPIPRQITTFEFKLIGFLTLKQFIYLVIFIPLGVVVYYLFPIPILNFLLAAATAGIGVAFAFLPINDRSLDIWVKNLIKRLTSPTQYIYQKQNPPLYFLQNLSFEADPHQIFTHIRSQELLNQYLKKTSPPSPVNQKKQIISNLFQTPSLSLKKSLSSSTSQKPTTIEKQGTATLKTPFFSGIVKNHKLIPLPGILIYVKDEKGKPVRLLKTNPHGVFATFNPLASGAYTFEIKDPKNIYVFDKMKFKIEGPLENPIEIFSKELL